MDICRQLDHHAERYFKKLFGRKDIEDALQRLDKLTHEEALMAAAESLTITRGIDTRLEGVDDTVRRVDRDVGSVKDGELFRFRPSPIGTQPCLVRCEGNRSSDSTSRQTIRRSK
jgi:hypothetical protein